MMFSKAKLHDGTELQVVSGTGNRRTFNVTKKGDSKPSMSVTTRCGGVREAEMLLADAGEIAAREFDFAAHAKERIKPPVGQYHTADSNNQTKGKK